MSDEAVRESSGGPTSESSGSSSSEDVSYVNGQNVEWIAIARSWVGGLLAVVILNVISIMTSTGEGIRMAIMGFAGWLVTLAEKVLSIPSTPTDTVVSEVTEFTDPLGPAAWPVAVLLVGLSMVLAYGLILDG